MKRNRLQIVYKILALLLLSLVLTANMLLVSSKSEFSEYQFNLDKYPDFTAAMGVKNNFYGFQDYRMYKELKSALSGKEVFLFTDVVLDPIFLSSISGAKVILEQGKLREIVDMDEKDLNSGVKEYSSIFLIRPIKLLSATSQRVVLAEGPFNWYLMDESDFVARVKAK